MNNSFDQIQADSYDFDARDAYEAQQEIWIIKTICNILDSIDGERKELDRIFKK